MTDRDILLQLQKSVTKGFAEVKQDIIEIKQDINNIVKKNNLKR